jgi:hypothetical protein
MTDSIRTLAVQYFQLVDPPHLAIPPGNVLVQPAVQQALYEHMFDESLTPLPPATYRTRVLKQILARIEEAITEPEEDVCSTTLTIHNDTVHTICPLTYLRKSPTV